MAQEQNISTQLDNLLVTRNFSPEMLDRQGKPSDSGEAKTFTFDYVSSSGKNYGTMVVVLDSENDMKVFYGDNLGRAMEGDDKDEFFDFQQHLSKFARMHRWTYSAKDLNQLKHTMQGLAAIQEGLFEGYYGTRRISYAGKPTEARLMIKHNRVLGEADARFRYVESLFIETADSQRFRLPFKNLAGGRAMLEHVRQGGNPYDVRGVHIAEMVMEIATLSRFNRASASRMLEGSTKELVTEAQTYYKSLRENIKRMASPRGYSAYFETWHPATIDEQQDLVEDIKTLFIEQTLDTRIEAALPLLARIQQQGNAMKEAQIFENWINSLTEGTWSLPETPEQLNKLKQLMTTELIVGPDATNATEQLYDLIGDDILFDRLSELADRDPRANVWNDTEVMDRIRELGIETETQAPAGAESDAAPVDPAAAPAPQQPVAEGSDDLRSAVLSVIQDIYNGAQAGEDMIDNVSDELGDYFNHVKRSKDQTLRKAYQLMRQQGVEAEGDPEMMAQVAKQAIDMLSQQGVAEELNAMRKAAGLPVVEGVLTDSTGSTLDHISNRFGKEVRDFETSGEMSDDLFHALYDYYFDDMPYGTKKGRDGDPYEWVSDRFAQDRGLDEGWKGAIAGGLAGGALGSVVPALGTLAGAAAGAYAGHKLGDQGFKDPDAEYKKAQKLKQTPPVSEADPISTFEVMSGFAAPTANEEIDPMDTEKSQNMAMGAAFPAVGLGILEGSCNMTTEGEYCPEHGLMECGMYEMGTVAGGMAPVVGEGKQDPLVRIKSLALIK